MKIKDHKQKAVKGDMLPLMDCMFILLIYFIFSMIDMTSYPGIKVNSPSATTSQKSADPFNVITIQNEALFLNKEPIKLENLKAHLQELEMVDITSKGKLLHVAADKETNTHAVFKVLEELRKIGKKKIYIESTKKSM